MNSHGSSWALHHSNRLNGRVSYSAQHLQAYRARAARRALAQLQSQSTTTRVYDVVALGNLCVDVVQPVKSLPAVDPQLLKQLTVSPPNTDSWELGGSCNFTIAASRLGLKAATVGHVAADVYGDFLRDVLREENVSTVEQIADDIDDVALDQTLICFVLVDIESSKHAFCSRYDFGPWPLLSGIQRLPDSALQVLARSRAVFTNGFLFDELPLPVVVNAIEYAASSGASIFFDPGPRCHTMKEGSRRVALDSMMDLSHVVLMTQEEALEVTGCTDAEEAARVVLSRPNSRTEWCIIKMGGDGAVLCTKSHTGAFHAKALQVEVADTVGCGDSFAAAVVLGYIRDHDIPSTMVLANAVGAATAMGRGAGRNVANAETVMDLLMEHAARSNGSGATVRSAIDILKVSLDQSGISMDQSSVC